MAILDRFPALKNTALVMAYCNGCINRECSQQEWLDEQDSVLGADGVDESDLRDIDAFLATLTEDQVLHVADGDEDDQNTILAGFRNPELISGLLNDIFDN